MLDIIHVNLLTDGTRQDNGWLRVENGKIAAMGSMAQYSPSAQEQLDGKGAFLCPGFMDIHNHGAMQFDAMDASQEAFDAIAKYHFEHGVTSFLFTGMTAPLPEIEKMFAALRGYVPPVPVTVLGVHMEGPFLSEGNRGAHPKALLSALDAQAAAFVEAHKDLLRLLTLAPNLPGAPAFIQRCVQNGIVVSGGHDNAIDTEVYAALQAGITGVTHLYCCSSTVGRRSDFIKHTGLTEIALNDERLFVEVIADGYHIPQDLFALIYKTKGYRKICLVSDAIRAAGLGAGTYKLGDATNGVEVEVQDGIALLPDHSAFAGSVTPISRMVERLVGKYHVPIEQAAYMASGTQAEYLHVAGKGALHPGFEAKLNLLDEQGKLLAVLAGEQERHITENGKKWENLA